MIKKSSVNRNSVKLPLISIITVVYNGVDYLEKTIESFVGQTYDNFEYIIVDGGSSDGTLDIIEKYDKFIDYWISDSDNGIADAMNKGGSYALGEYLVFIHAGDCLENKFCLKNLSKQLIANKPDILMCSVLFGKKRIEIQAREGNWLIFFKMPACHQGVVCKRGVFNLLGGFDIRFLITMDYDFILRAYNYGVLIKKTSLVLSIMDDTGISSRQDWKGLLQRFNEERRVHLKNCNTLVMSGIYSLYWPLYLLYRLFRQVKL